MGESKATHSVGKSNFRSTLYQSHEKKFGRLAVIDVRHEVFRLARAMEDKRALLTKTE